MDYLIYDGGVLFPATNSSAEKTYSKIIMNRSSSIIENTLSTVYPDSGGTILNGFIFRPFKVNKAIPTYGPYSGTVSDIKYQTGVTNTFLVGYYIIKNSDNLFESHIALARGDLYVDARLRDYNVGISASYTSGTYQSQITNVDDMVELIKSLYPDSKEDPIIQKVAYSESKFTNLGDPTAFAVINPYSNWGIIVDGSGCSFIEFSASTSLPVFTSASTDAAYPIRSLCVTDFSNSRNLISQSASIDSRISSLEEDVDRIDEDVSKITGTLSNRFVSR